MRDIVALAAAVVILAIADGAAIADTGVKWQVGSVLTVVSPPEGTQRSGAGGVCRFHAPH